MAFTLTKAASTVFGNQLVWQGIIAADATTGVVSFGFKTITHVQATPKSSSTQANNFRINALAEGTASAGDLAITGCLATADFYVTVYGR